MYGVESKPHLGGYIVGLTDHGDPNSYATEVWDWMIENNIKSVIDVGCGEGHSTKYFSDRDIECIGVEELGDYDIACQNDTGQYYCSGFFICRGNESTLNMFSEMKKNYEAEDQTTLNKHIHMVKSKFLSNKFFTIGHLLGLWTVQEFNMPYPILVHHSNWTSGIENKIKLLDIVRKKVENNV